MSSKIAEYQFTDYDAWKAAQNRLSEKLGDVYTSQSTSDYYYIAIWDNCDDPKSAAQICSGNGGSAC